MAPKKKEVTLEEVAARQQEIAKEMVELKASVEEIITLFTEGKSVLRFMVGAGNVAKWLAVTVASCAALWAYLHSTPKG